MFCGSINDPSKILKCILENDVPQLHNYLSEKRNVNPLLQFADDSNDTKKMCWFTPLATSLLYGNEETLKVILEAGADVNKPCRYDTMRRCRCGNPDEDVCVTTRMEPAILLTRLLCQFRDGARWHLLMPMCEAGLNPTKSSRITIIDREEEGGSIHHQFSTTVLDEVYVKMNSRDYDRLLAYCDVSRTLARAENQEVDRLYDLLLCPVRTRYDKFASVVKNGFYELNLFPTNIDQFTDLILERTKVGTYYRTHLYHDIFKRFQILMLVCDYRFTSFDDYGSLGAFVEDDIWIGGQSYVLTFMARLQDIVHKWNSRPKRLSLICRNKIRRHVHRPHFVDNVKKLDLPKFLEDFVILPSDAQWRKMGMRALDLDFNEGLPECEL